MRSGPGAERMNVDAYRRELENHSAWLQSAKMMLAAAERLWPAAQLLLDDVVARRREVEADIERRANVRRPWLAPPNPNAWGLDRLVEHVGAMNAYLLNAGYAVENFLKAVRVKRLRLHGVTIRPGGGPDKLFTKHTCYDIAARVELDPVSDAESDLLNRLGTFVQWAGRYPMPLKPPTLAELGRRRLNQQTASWLMHSASDCSTDTMRWPERD